MTVRAVPAVTTTGPLAVVSVVMTTVVVALAVVSVVMTTVVVARPWWVPG